MRVRVEMPSAQRLIRKKGLDRDGAVQLMVTQVVFRHMVRYMPKRTGALIKKTVISSNSTITVPSPSARYLYYGKVMVGKAPKTVTDKDLVYTKSNPLAGPFWDRTMMQNEGKKIASEIEEEIKRRGK